MVGSILGSLDTVLEDRKLTLGLDHLVSQCHVVGIDGELPLPVADVLELLLQSLLQVDEELRVLGLESSPLNVLWVLRQSWMRRKVLREILSRDCGA